MDGYSKKELMEAVRRARAFGCSAELVLEVRRKLRDPTYDISSLLEPEFTLAVHEYKRLEREDPDALAITLRLTSDDRNSALKI